MRLSLHLAYLSLLSVTCISSCFLFFAVVTGSSEYVAANSDTIATTQTLPTESATASAAEVVAQANSAATPNAATKSVTHEEVLPNYKKVKKLHNAPRDPPRLRRAATKAHEDVPPPVEAANGHATVRVATAAEPVLVSAPISNVAADARVAANLPQQTTTAAETETEAEASMPHSDSISEEAIVMPNLNEGKFVANKVPKQRSEAMEDTEATKVLQSEQLQYEINKEATVDKHGEDGSASSLPDITEIPTITVTELPLDLLEPTRANIDALVIDAAKESITREHENRTHELLENGNEAIRKDEQIIKFDDSGGGGDESLPADQLAISNEIPENIPNVNVNASSTTPPTTTSLPAVPDQQNTSSSDESEDAATGDSSNGTLNLTAEEVPIPVFSEWAQKQMEAAEKQQAMEQEVVNTSAQKKNHTNGSGKAPSLKIRNKNYASPDCGAKIIASNADASNTGAVLSSSKDEYMLSPCGNRIWFVVELCEAIQAQKVELANFELFSSSPKNFTVAVSNRFPTRDWSNVGRFIAEDKRNVQSFDLHPHLFGKFVRVDIHSHYSKEHFCPVSLFRVFGTSEFEAFETENQPHMDMDDFDDEFAQEQARAAKNAEQNLFKSASDAVLSIVKKAAEVLVKPTNNLNTTLTTQTQRLLCRTPATGQFSCLECNRSLVERINNALSCEFQQLQALLQVQWLRRDLLKTRICATQYGIETKIFAQNDCANQLLENPFEMNVKQSYYLNILPMEYVGALCQLLATQYSLKSHTAMPEDGENAEPALNLTIDKKLKKDDFKIIDGSEKRLITPETAYTTTTTESAETFSGDGETMTTTTEGNVADEEQLPRPPQAESEAPLTSTPTAPTTKEPAPDVNIFNVPEMEQQQEQQHTQQQQQHHHHQQQQQQQHSNEVYDSSIEANYEGSAEYISTTTMEPPTSVPTSTEAMSHVTVPALAKSEEDTASWESFDHLLTSTTASPGNNNAPSDNAAINTAGINLQAKIPSGPQSESVFIRLSNRIKALERNMSLSGQYLEELSRRYKKQVEELQLTLTQQVQTVRLLEEQNRRHNELQQLLAQRNAQLKEELDDMSLQVHACIVVIIFVGAFVFLVLMVSILFYRSMRRETKDLLVLYTSTNKKKTANAVAAMQKKLNRRKSFEDFSDHQQNSEKMRRPSEEALMILKERGVGTTIENVGDTAQATRTAAQRERKISVCYNNNGNSLNGGGSSGINILSGAKCNVGGKRRGEKHSWPNTEHTQQQARQHLAQLEAPDNDELIQNLDHHMNGKAVEMYVRQRNAQFANGSSIETNGKNGKTRKKSQNLRRHDSTPNDFGATTDSMNSNATATEINTGYDESLRLEEDDLDNFIPTSDLAYNEFMPEGPSGYQVDDGAIVDGKKQNGNSNKAEGKKIGRLGAPGFFKSPFSKSLKLRAKSKHPHESTSWEWYRSKNAQQKQLSVSASASGGFLRASPTQSIDSSSLSEVHFPSSCTENSFRILEEAILSSGERLAKSASTANSTTATAVSTTNGNGHTHSSSNCNSNNSNSGSGSGSSAASNSNRSSTSSTSTKKKKRSFNNIFRKVF